jgi:hypothetical protein
MVNGGSVYQGTAVYEADGMVTYTGGGQGTWMASGSSVTVSGVGSTGSSFVDHLTLSSDGNEMTGINGSGDSILEVRTGDTSPVGTWVEMVNGGSVYQGTAVYNSDGTVTYTGGGEGTWVASGSSVTVNGAGSTGSSFVDRLTLSSDGNEMTGTNGSGDSIVESRTSW